MTPDSQLEQNFISSDIIGAEKCIRVMIVNDETSDPDEIFYVSVSSSNARVRFFGNLITVIIIDDDGKSYCSDK